MAGSIDMTVLMSLVRPDFNAALGGRTFKVETGDAGVLRLSKDLQLLKRHIQRLPSKTLRTDLLANAENRFLLELLEVSEPGPTYTAVDEMIESKSASPPDMDAIETTLTLLAFDVPSSRVNSVYTKAVSDYPTPPPTTRIRVAYHDLVLFLRRLWKHAKPLAETLTKAEPDRLFNLFVRALPAAVHSKMRSSLIARVRSATYDTDTVLSVLGTRMQSRDPSADENKLMLDLIDELEAARKAAEKAAAASGRKPNSGQKQRHTTTAAPAAPGRKRKAGDGDGNSNRHHANRTSQCCWWCLRPEAEVNHSRWYHCDERAAGKPIVKTKDPVILSLRRRFKVVPLSKSDDDTDADDTDDTNKTAHDDEEKDDAQQQRPRRATTTMPVLEETGLVIGAKLWYSTEAQNNHGEPDPPIWPLV